MIQQKIYSHNFIIITMPNKDISKFGETFISYGTYHYDIVNKIIHIFCIPIITATLLAALSYIPYRIDVFTYNLGFEHLFCLFALIFYFVAVGIPACILMGSLLFAGASLWKYAFADFNHTEMRNSIIALHIIGWVFQFIGHGVFEKRKPALLDNLSQIFSAPLFVFIELCDLLGLRTAEIEVWKGEIKKRVELYRKSQKMAVN